MNNLQRAPFNMGDMSMCVFTYTVIPTSQTELTTHAGTGGAVICTAAVLNER